MFKRIRQFLAKIMHIGQAIQDVGTAADSIQDITRQRSIKDLAAVTAQAAKETGTAIDAVQEASE
jgi:hypothetical protein